MIYFKLPSSGLFSGHKVEWLLTDAFYIVGLSNIKHKGIFISDIFFACQTKVCLLSRCPVMWWLNWSGAIHRERDRALLLLWLFHIYKHLLYNITKIVIVV